MPNRQIACELIVVAWLILFLHVVCPDLKGHHNLNGNTHAFHQIDTCEIDDTGLLALLSASPGLCFLELNAVSRVSGPGLMAALRELKELRHLVVCDVEPDVPATAVEAAEVRATELQLQSAQGGTGTAGGAVTWFGFLTAPLFGGGSAASAPQLATPLSLNPSTAKAAVAQGEGRNEALMGSANRPPRHAARRCLTDLPDALSSSISSLRHLEWAPSSHDPLSIEELMLLATRSAVV